MKLTKDQFS